MALPERLSSELFSLLPRTGARRDHACRHTRHPRMTDPSCAPCSSSHRGSAAATKLFPSSTQPAGCCQCAANHKQRRTTRTLQSPIRALSVQSQQPRWRPTPQTRAPQIQANQPTTRPNPLQLTLTSSTSKHNPLRNASIVEARNGATVASRSPTPSTLAT